MTIHNRQIC